MELKPRTQWRMANTRGMKKEGGMSIKNKHQYETKSMCERGARGGVRRCRAVGQEPADVEQF